MKRYALANRNEIMYHGNFHHNSNHYSGEVVRSHLLGSSRNKMEQSGYEADSDQDEIEYYPDEFSFFINRGHLISTEKDMFYWKKTLAKCTTQFLFHPSEKEVDQSFLFQNFARIYFGKNEAGKIELDVKHAFLNRNNQILKYPSFPQINLPWTDEDRENFIQAYLKYPKKFGLIAKECGKGVSDCVRFYYRNKKKIGLKRRLRQKVLGTGNNHKQQRSSASSVKE